MPSELRVDKVSSTTSPYDPVFSTTGGALSHRNMIINGAMQVCQRIATDTLVEVSNAAYNGLDRWKTWESTDGTYQVKQAHPLGAIPGFERTLYLSPNSADTSIANSQYALVGQVIEAQNLTHIGIGTASAKPLTLSFYIKSNLTGKMNAYIAKYDNNTRIVPLEFDLPSSAGTWERITLTVPALTSGGLINNDNGIGFEVIWVLSIGNTYKVGTNGTWSSNGNAISTSNHNVNFMSSTSNYIEITGVQLELGTVATPFEHRSYADELARCQRYFQAHQLLGKTVFPYSGSRFFCPVAPFVPMRSRTGLTVSKTNTVSRMTTPSVTDYWVHGGADYANGDWFHSMSLNVSGGVTDSGFVLDIYLDRDGDSDLTDQEPVMVTLVNNTARNGASSTGGFLHYETEL